MTRLQIITSHQSSRMAQLRKYLTNRRISRKLSFRVLRNAQHAMVEQKRNVAESKVEVLQVISTPLMVEVHFEVYSPLLLSHDFFSCFANFNPAGMRRVCHSAVSMVRLSPGDVLFSDHEKPSHPRMFFVQSGRLQYMRQDGSTSPLSCGNWASEPVLWTTWTHCGTMRAEAHSQLIELDAQKFRDVLDAFPMQHVGRYAEAFVHILNMASHDEPEVLDDMGDFLENYIPEMLVYAFPEIQGPINPVGGTSDLKENESGNSTPRFSALFDKTLRETLRERESQSGLCDELEKAQDKVRRFSIDSNKAHRQNGKRPFRHAALASRIRLIAIWRQRFGRFRVAVQGLCADKPWRRHKHRSEAFSQVFPA